MKKNTGDYGNKRADSGPETEGSGLFDQRAEPLEQTSENAKYNCIDGDYESKRLYFKLLGRKDPYKTRQQEQQAFEELASYREALVESVYLTIKNNKRVQKYIYTYFSEIELDDPDETPEENDINPDTAETEDINNQRCQTIDDILTNKISPLGPVDLANLAKKLMYTKQKRHRGTYGLSDNYNRIKSQIDDISERNQRLIVNLAKRYPKELNITIMDDVQAGNVGLLKAIDRYDPSRGLKFSTYARWWVRHAITRQRADNGKTVRTPVHQISLQNKVRKTIAKLQGQLSRDPEPEEIAAEIDLKTEKVIDIIETKSKICSLDAQISEEGDSFVETFENSHNIDPLENIQTDSYLMQIPTLLRLLDPRSRKIIEARFGMDDPKGDSRTLREIGQELRCSKENVRQIQEKALSKMRNYAAELEEETNNK